MPIPTDEQIYSWCERWERHPGLPKKIAQILRGNAPAQNADEAARRMWAVNDLLRGLNDPEFEVYKHNGVNESVLINSVRKSVQIPILNLCCIPWIEEELDRIFLPHARLTGTNLRSACLKEANLSNALLEKANLMFSDLEKADLSNAHMERADLGSAFMKGAKLYHAFLEEAIIDDETHLERADLRITRLEGVELRGGRLQGAELLGASLKGSYLPETHLEGANFTYVSLGKRLLERETYSEDISSKDVYKLIIDQNQSLTTSFSQNSYLPRFCDLIKEKRFSAFWRLLTNRWFYTNFTGVKIEDADTALAADLRRYVEDQRFIKRIKDKFPFLYHLWNWSTACGWAAWRVAALSLVAMAIFAYLFASAPLLPSKCVGLGLLVALPFLFLFFFDRLMVPLTSRLPQVGICGWFNRRSLIFWTVVGIILIWTLGFGLPVSWEWALHDFASWVPGLKLLTLEQGQRLVAAMDGSPVSPYMQWFYISFDIFTNLGIRVDTQPLCDAGVIAMFAETVCGWVALGLLLTVFASKIARRA